MKKYFGNILSPNQILTDEPMKRHTTFRIGGNADIMLLPQTIDEVKDCIDVCRDNDISFFVMGNGSNLLVGDKGYRGAIIKIAANLSAISIEETKIKAEAGVLLSKVATEAQRSSLAGLEFASGIPGTVGGAVCMNAGAYGGEIKDVVTNITVIDNGEIKTLTTTEAAFEYRSSAILKGGMTVLSAEFILKNGNAEDIKKQMDDIKHKRIEKQPLEYPSAGSTFKRPEGYFAGKLIEDAGLRGFSVGDAQVSEKHCGFIINKGNASAKDILSLIEEVKTKVYNKFNVQLCEEVRMIGEF